MATVGEKNSRHLDFAKLLPEAVPLQTENSYQALRSTNTSGFHLVHDFSVPAEGGSNSLVQLHVVPIGSLATANQQSNGGAAAQTGSRRHSAHSEPMALVRHDTDPTTALLRHDLSSPLSLRCQLLFTASSGCQTR